MNDDTAKLEEKAEFLNRQLTQAQMENRKLRDEIGELKDTVIGLAEMVVKSKHVSE